MKRFIALASATVFMTALLAPSLASAVIISPSTAKATGEVGKWGTLTSTSYLTWPTSTTVKVGRVGITVKSTHLGLHYVNWTRVQVRTGTSTVYNNRCDTNHWISGMGSATCSHYPNKTLNRYASNRTGTSIEYMGLATQAVTTPVYWTPNYGG
ncbi:MAG: hypothetical protein RBS17_04665 [Coriobacteriia bacterium]|nr:hypothetical protein [Coriobacteriia bacterium]